MTNTTSKKKILGLGAASVIAFSLIGAGVAQAGAMGAFDQSINNSTVIAAVKAGFTQQLMNGANVVSSVDSTAAGATSTSLESIFGKFDNNQSTSSTINFVSAAGNANQVFNMKLSNVVVKDASGATVTDNTVINAVLNSINLDASVTPEGGSSMRQFNTGIADSGLMSASGVNFKQAGNVDVVVPGGSSAMLQILATTGTVNSAYQGYSVTGDFIVKSTTV